MNCRGFDWITLKVNYVYFQPYSHKLFSCTKNVFASCSLSGVISLLY